MGEYELMNEIIEKPHPKPRIFISYARSDGEESARKLRRRLIDKYNLSIWQDRTSMEGGKDWWQQIEDALRSKHVEHFVLVMTPNALLSDMVQREWRLAKSLGVCIEPVIASSGLNFQSMPQWMRSAHFVDPDAPEQWDRFILTLKSSCQIQRVPFMVEDLHDFVNRPDEFDQLISNLIENNREMPVAITAALRGAGGYGKTTLAMAICHDERVQEAFYDGILWVTLGKEAGNLTEKVNDLIEILSGERPGFKSIESAANHLVELIAHKYMLIVIDDVWNSAHLKPFLQGGPQCARLITTRNFDTLPPNAKKIDVDAMNQDEAVTLISLGLPEGDEDHLRKLAARLCEWPLLLKLANGALRDRIYNTGQTLPDAISFFNRALDNRGLAYFDARNASSREQAAGKTISVSLELLNSKELARYNELAIFPEDADIPLYTLEKLWKRTGGFAEFDTEELCDRLRKLSLLLRFDPVTGQIRIHDIMRQYLIHEPRNNWPALHNHLLDAYRSSLPRHPQSSFTEWASLSAKEQYLWRNITYHLIEAERNDELRKLLFNFTWLSAKLEATDVNSMIADYDFLPYDETLPILQDAIRLSAHILAEKKTQLRSQLYGRLMSHEEPEIKNLLEQIKQKSGLWLCPLTQSLTPPGGPLLRTMEDHMGWVNAIVMMPDGKRMISGSWDKTLKIWDIQAGKVLRILYGHTDQVTSVALMSDGKRVISASLDNTLKIWNIETGKLIKTLNDHNGSVQAVAVFQDGKRVISASSDNTLKIWDIKTGNVLKTLKGHTGSVEAVAVLQDGKRVISASVDNTLKIWDTETGKILNTLGGHTNKVTALSVMPDGKRVISGSWDETLKIWDIDTGNTLNTLHSIKSVTAIAIIPDGKRLISASFDHKLRIWDIEAGKILKILEGHTNQVTSVAAFPDGNRIISAAWDMTLKIWDIKTNKIINRLQGHADLVNAVAVIPDGKSVISASFDNTLKIWDIETGNILNTLYGHTQSVTSVAVMPDGKRVISGSWDETLKIWDIKTGNILNTLYGHTHWINSVAVMPDGKSVISASFDNTLKIWDIETGNILNTLYGHTQSVTSVAVMRDGKRVISGSWDKTLKIWDIETGNIQNTLHGHTGFINAVAVMPDRKRMISASFDHTLKIWDIQTGKVLKTFQTHIGSQSVAVSLNGKRVISDSDKSLKIWDIETGEVIACFCGDSPILSCTVSLDGTIFIAGEVSGSIHFLRMEEIGAASEVNKKELVEKKNHD